MHRTAFCISDSEPKSSTIFVVMKFTFGAQQKLKSRKSIEELFMAKQQVRKGAIKAMYLLYPGALPHQIGVSVSKRLFKKAPDRNRVKRLMRESYRLQQHQLQAPEGFHYKIMLIFQSPKKPTYDQTCYWVKGCLNQIMAITQK